MENGEEGKPCKIEKPSSPAKDHQSSAHAYPDWAMMQAYYGPHFTVPLYLNSAVASPHILPPPYMWVLPPQPQNMVLPSYPVYYAHEGVYGHPGVWMGSTDTPAESTGNTDGGRLAVSIGNGNADSGEHGRLSESLLIDFFYQLNECPKFVLYDGEVTYDSSDGINGVTAEAEAGELATKVETLISENMRLKSEIDKFTEISKKLELENATLMETIKDARPGEVNIHLQELTAMVPWREETRMVMNRTSREAQ